MILRTAFQAGCALLLLAGWTFGQESPLQSIGPDADVVVRLKEPDRTIEKVTSLASSIQPQFGDQVQQQAQMLGAAISNPTQTGVDQSQDWYVVAFARADQPPQVVFAIPAIDADQMKQALGEGMTTAVKGKYVFYTEAPGEIPLADSADASINAKIGGLAGELFQKGDLSVFVNVDHLTSVYREQIDAGYDQILQQLNNLRFQLPQGGAAGGFNLAPMIDTYGQVIEKLFQALNDTSHLAVAVNVSDSGATIEDYVAFHPDSTTGQGWGADAASSLELIEKLPENAAVYYAAHGGLEALTKWGVELNTMMIQDAEQKEAVQEALKKLEGMEFGTLAGSFTVTPGNNGLFRGVSITEVKPAAAMKEASREIIEAMGHMEVAGLTQDIEVQKDAETYGEYKADVFKIKQTFDTSTPVGEMQQKMQRFMFGPDGMTTRNVFLEDKYISSIGGGRDVVQQTLNRLEGSSGNGLSEYRKDLLSPANLQFLIDIPTLAGQAIKAAAEFAESQMPFDASIIDNLNLGRSFVGFSLAARSNGIHCKTDIPVEQVQGIMKIVAAVGAAAAGARGF